MKASSSDTSDLSFSHSVNFSKEAILLSVLVSMIVVLVYEEAADN